MDHNEAWQVRRSFTPEEAALLAVGLIPGMHTCEGSGAEVVMHELVASVNAAFKRAEFSVLMAGRPDEDVPPGLEPIVPWDDADDRSTYLPTIDLDRNLRRAIKAPTRAGIGDVEQLWENPLIDRTRLAEWFQARGVSTHFAFVRSSAGNPPPPKLCGDKPLTTKSRNTLLKIIAALAKELKIDITQPSKASDAISRMTDLNGARVGPKAIEKYLKEISALNEGGN